MRNMLVKDMFKEIKKSLGRFLSIMAITALGVSFFAGIKVAPVYMRDSLDKYYDNQNYMDFTIVSTLGLTGEDVDSIKSIEGIKDVIPSKSMDVLLNQNNTDVVTKVLGIPQSYFKNEENDFINKPLLIEGRMPENQNECLIEKNEMEAYQIKIGEKVKLSSGTETNIEESLTETEYTVVGYVQTPSFLSFEKGRSNIGSGEINNLIMIYQENFKGEIFSEIYVTVNDVKSLNSFDEEYFKSLEPVAKGLEKLGIERAGIRYNEVVGEANKKIKESEDELKKGKEDALKQLDEARQKIESSKKSLNKGEQDLKNNEIKFNKDMEEANKKIKDAENELIKGEAQYDNAVAVFEEAKKTLKPQIDKANSEIATLTKEKLELDNRLKTVEEKLKDPNITNEERLALEREKINLSAQITEKNFKINTISEGLKAYNKLLKEAQDRLNEAKRKVDYGKEELHKQKINLENGKRIAKGEFDKGKRALEDGKIKLAQGEEEYEKGRKEAELKIADGERKLAEAKEKVAAISEPEWYVLDREKNYSYMSYKSSTDSVDAIAQVFPLFFFLVAALVCLTTMTRMVDEQRVNMGTMKALGYSTWKIASKYLIYAAVASICGSVIGIIVGMNIFPTVIFEAYGMMFNIPELIKEFNLYYSSLATISVVGITTLAAYFACYKDLKEVPSSLMRPKAPPEGKRILLERISFVWNRLNFIGKVTARNIFRYKKRFLMTVIGISGCTALLLAGFGIKDSIEIIIDKQFGEIFKYNLEIGIEDDASIEDLERIDSYLTKNNGVLNYMNLESKYQKVYDDTTEKDVILMVPKEVENMEEFIVLRERGNGNAIELTDEGVVITEKLATTFNVRKGDSISVKDENGYSYNVKVIGVTENYVSHYMYMTANLYEKIHGATPRFNNILTTNEKIDKDFETNLSNKLSQDSKVASVGFNSGVKDSFSDTVSSLNIVVIVMIISAGALAFVVLYNLTNVNISERLREIATIKVLGFYDNEVSSYVFRENFILTFIGSLVGLGLGTALHRFIIITAEMDNFMFGRVLDVSSYLYAIVLTIVFAAVVNFAMYYKLRNVPMVESLKSVD